MKKLTLLLMIVLLAPVAFPRGHRSSGSHRSSTSTQHKKVQVRSYTRRNGTTVHSYSRSAPRAAGIRSNRVSAAGGSRSRRSSAGIFITSNGRAKRSPAAKASFMRSHPCPSTGKRSGGCPGYVVDHVRPLAKGGADNPSNMQWQTVQAAKEKDKWERK
jgi:hypothetical protein